VNRRVPWWQAFLSVPLLVGLFIGEQRLRLSLTGHQTVQVIIVLFVFGLLTLWLKAQDGALIHEEYRRHQMTFVEREDVAPVFGSEASVRGFPPVSSPRSSAGQAEPLPLPPVEVHPLESPSRHSLN
jgi:hypothetical protein